MGTPAPRPPRPGRAWRRRGGSRGSHATKVDGGEGADPVVVAQVERLQHPPVELDLARGEVAGELVERLDLQAGRPDRRDPPVHGRTVIGVVTGDGGRRGRTGAAGRSARLDGREPGRSLTSTTLRGGRRRDTRRMAFDTAAAVTPHRRGLDPRHPPDPGGLHPHPGTCRRRSTRTGPSTATSTGPSSWPAAWCEQPRPSPALTVEVVRLPGRTPVLGSRSRPTASRRRRRHRAALRPPRQAAADAPAGARGSARGSRCSTATGSTAAAAPTTATPPSPRSPPSRPSRPRAAATPAASS